MTTPVSYLSLQMGQNGEEFIQTFDEVLILAIDASGSVLFGIEPSPAFGGERVLILPGGTVGSDEALAETANRELQEEVGYRADQLTYLGELRPWSKYLSLRTHVYLGRELQESKLAGDEIYPVEVRRVSLLEVDDLVADGRLQDARAIAALYLARPILATAAKC